MYPYAYSYSFSSFLLAFLPLIALIVVIAGGIALYMLFARKPNRWHGAAGKLHELLAFRRSYTEVLMRVLYCVTVVAIAVYSVILLFFHFFLAILLFVLGNIAARIGFEFMLMLFSMHRTLRDISRKMPNPPQVSPAAPQAPAAPVQDAPQDAPAQPSDETAPPEA